MKAVFGLIMMMALGLCLYALQAGQIASLTGAANPSAIVDSVAVKTELMGIANAERQQFALEGRYLSLEELRARGVDVPERRGSYVFSADVTDRTFLISATFETPAGSPPHAPLTIGPDMQIR